jgi:plasmid stabilization system protein ParE
MNVRYLSVAEAELDEAFTYYQEQEVGLGVRFYAEVRNTVDRIVAYPEAWSPVSENTRRCRTKVFPYGVIYQVREDGILIVAIAHLHRKPEFWRERL